MAHIRQIGFELAAVAAVFTTLVGPVLAQNHAPNPYRTVEGVWGQLGQGRTWGSTSAVYIAPDGMNVWVGERCGGNQGACMQQGDWDPIMLFSPNGELVRSFGAGMIVWPHGLHVDPDGNVWVADAAGAGDKGHQVHKFSATGELLMSLGTAGVAGAGQDTFNQPSDMLVAPDGSIFVVDGHGAGNNNRVVKFAPDGSYLMEWGRTGYAPGEFRTLHAIALDQRGRVFVADRSNNRIQIFDQEGNFLSQWTQFGRPSGIFFDDNDQIYVADSESDDIENPGWEMGIRIGNALSGWVTDFILYPAGDPRSRSGNGAEFVAVDRYGNMYGGEPRPRNVQKYVRVRP